MPSGPGSIRCAILLAVWFTGLLPSLAVAWSTIELEADLDNTLYQTERDTPKTQNELSNGRGNFLFAGRTGLDAGFRSRRGLLRFDLSVLPEDSVILSAQVVLYLSRAAPGAPPSPMTLHRVLQPWGEGKSDAAGPEGQGAFAAPGDATWFQNLYQSDKWRTPGGTFESAASTATTVGSITGDYVWPCTQALLLELNSWLDNPSGNHGWLLLGFEEGALNARRFRSREHPEAETRPRLLLTYSTPEMILSDGFETSQDCT